ncbi:alpha/beta fold hydrolase [Lysobacter sp. cf310]|uniref:alpha/beta fold hydrolase n=1 Tax=Lysobacter sp. cf310 TaxID=1761790 RepID=UPI0008F3037A|nr:alpha/beta hydrolase [Lysobacter sp. cf310]SFK48749.1 Pimeloyl-ACP methyl ester carboxylesterase [Lysobacter sp. cf310]
MSGGQRYFADRRTVDTPSGRISYVEQGQGPVALFVHGVLLNGYLWRHQLAELGDSRRCIALDLLGHGYTEAGAGQDASVTANAHMLAQFLDALGIDRVDLVGNDSGGGICQIFAALYPQRIRSLALSNCDAHDNWPPEAFKPFVAMVAAGGLGDTLRAMQADKSVFRSALAPAYERPDQVSDATIDTYLRPLLEPARLAELERFVNAFDCRHTLAIEDGLRRLQAPTLIAWGTDDVYFPLPWSLWLQQTIPGTVRRVEFEGARIFFPEERWQDFNCELRAHWQAHSVEQAGAQAATA